MSEGKKQKFFRSNKVPGPELPTPPVGNSSCKEIYIYPRFINYSNCDYLWVSIVSSGWHVVLVVPPGWVVVPECISSLPASGIITRE